MSIDEPAVVSERPPVVERCVQTPRLAVSAGDGEALFSRSGMWSLPLTVRLRRRTGTRDRDTGGTGDRAQGQEQGTGETNRK